MGHLHVASTYFLRAERLTEFHLVPTGRWLAASSIAGLQQYWQGVPEQLLASAPALFQLHRSTTKRSLQSSRVGGASSLFS